MKKYKLNVILPDDEIYDYMKDIISGHPYEEDYAFSIAPPNLVLLEFKSLSEIEMNNYKELFRELYKDSKYPYACHFEMEEE